jgi:protein tyrosine phosphatase (PTP) superfamily phosphohydrolase (DUF442 family)
MAAGPARAGWDAGRTNTPNKSLNERRKQTQSGEKMNDWIRIAATLMALGIGSIAQAGELSDITNYRAYSPVFSSSGQPTKDELKLLKDEGFERIVYIAFSNNGNAYADEDVLVKELGMDYVHIPVIWEQPTAADFYAFASVMQRAPDRKTLLHCQVNYRASAFSFLYRVLYDNVAIATAKADMNSVWQPDETWRKLIFDILEENGLSADCDGCNWETDD